MDKIIKICFFVFALFAIKANAAFVDAYDVSSWSTSVNKGKVITSGAPNSVTLQSSNASFGERNQDFFYTSEGWGTVSFDWSYKTADNRGSAYDAFGWLLNGVFTKLTNDTAGNIQSGSYVFNVKIGDIFGFRINSLDSQKGSGSGTVSNFSGPNAVPAPGALWLMAAPVLALLRKKRSA